VINDERLALFDTSTFELEAMLPLVPDRTQEARSVTVTSDRVVSFDLVERALLDVPQRDGRVVQMHRVQISQFRPDARVVRPARVLGRRTMTIPAARLRLRLQSPEGRPMAMHGWARMETPDGRRVHVEFSSTTDGLAHLPAFEPGPFSVVEVARRQSQHRAVLRDVIIGETPLNVTLQAE
jgi:hypothetical protein